jgi:hypothetical protein
MDYLENPFKVIDGEIKEAFKRIEGGDYRLADVDSGEVNVFTKAAKNKRVMVDTGNYIKVYRRGALVASKLSQGSIVMFFYIMLHLKPHTDSISLEASIVCKWGGISDRTYYRAFSELLEKNIIARKKGSSIEFFVNINYVFNGSRLKMK